MLFQIDNINGIALRLQGTAATVIVNAIRVVVSSLSRVIESK